MAKKRLNDVKWTTQSFSGAGGLEMFPNLEMGSGFRVGVYAERSVIFREGIERLVSLATEKGYSHVFGVSYEISYSGKYKDGCDPNYGKDQNLFIADGTGYKPKK